MAERGGVAVLCPTRGRPQSCIRMIRSVIDTSDADVLVYTDTDDAPVKVAAELEARVKSMEGPRRGMGGSMNALVDRFRSYRVYCLGTDDSWYTRKGWDEELLAAMDSFGDDIGLVHHSSGSDDRWVNFPCVSRRWIDALGWFCPPTIAHYCQDTALQNMAEALGRIVYLASPALVHEPNQGEDNGPKFVNDSRAFVFFMAMDFGPSLTKLKGAMWPT